MDWELLKSLEMKQIELLTQLKNAGDETQKKQIREQLRGIDGQIQEMKEKVMKVPAQTMETQAQIRAELLLWQRARVLRPERR